MHGPRVVGGLLTVLREFFSDLQQGDPVALVFAGIVLFLAAFAGVIWVVDLRKHKFKVRNTHRLDQAEQEKTDKSEGGREKQHRDRIVPLAESSTTRQRRNRELS